MPVHNDLGKRIKEHYEQMPRAIEVKIDVHINRNYKCTKSYKRCM